MKHKSKLMSILSLVMVASMVLAACAPATTPAPAQPTTAPAEPTAAPAQPTAAPAQPTAAPVEPTAAPTTPPAAAGPTPGGKMVVSNQSGNYNTLDPFITPWHDVASYAVFDTLLAIKPDLTGYVGLLVDDKWEVAPDNMSVTFHVRPGIKFQDGTPVDAAAIKWNLDHWTDAKVAAPGGGNITSVYKSSEAKDASTLVITLSSPYAPLYNELAGLEMVSPTAYQGMGPDKFAQEPVGAGPFKVKQIIANDSITYVRNPDYKWAPEFYENKGPVFPDEFVVKYVADDQVAYAALETGEITIVASIPAQFLEQAKANPNIEVVKGQEAGGEYLGFNTQFPPFDDPKVRTAIAYAINRDEIIQVGFDGEAVPMYSNLAASEIGYSQEAEDYGKAASDNVDTAKQMLADLGYTPGSDGVLAKNGKKLEFMLSTTTEDYRKRIAETIQAQLQEIGVKVNIDIKESQVVREMTQKGTHQMILWGFGLIDPNILTYLFHSSRMGVSNRTRYVNKDLDKMLTEADSMLDYNTRMQKVTEIEKFLVDQRPNVPLFSKLSYAGYRKDQVAGLKFDKLGGYLTMDAYMLEK